MAKPKTENKQNIRYLGFETAVDGARRFEFLGDELIGIQAASGDAMGAEHAP